MPERQLVHESERRTTQDRNLAAGLQPAASAQFAELPIASRVCTDTSGDERMRKTSTGLLEQGTQTRLLRNSNLNCKNHNILRSANQRTATYDNLFEFRNSLKRRPLAPDLIPAETRTENSHWDWYSQRGHFTLVMRTRRPKHSLAT